VKIKKIHHEDHEGHKEIVLYNDFSNLLFVVFVIFVVEIKRDSP
jgi:hypothetical protein